MYDKNLTDKLKHEFIELCFKKNSIVINKNNIGIDNSEVFDIFMEKIVTDCELKMCYSNLIHEQLKKYYADIYFSLNDISHTILNSIMFQEFNLNHFYLKGREAIKKGILDFNKLIKILESSSSSPNIVIPVFSENIISISLLNSWIKLLVNICKPDKIIVCVLFNIGKSKLTDTLNKLQLEINKSNNNINTLIINDNLISLNYLIDTCYSRNIINDSLFKSLSLFYTKNIHPLSLNLIEKNSNNYLYKKFKDIIATKKTRLCISLENINDTEEIIKYCNLIGPYIAAIKINSNFLFNEALLNGIKKLSTYHKFIVIDDKKIIIRSLNDLNLEHLYKWVDIITVSINIMDKNIETVLENNRKMNKYASIILDYELYQNNLSNYISKNTTNNNYSNMVSLDNNQQIKQSEQILDVLVYQSNFFNKYVFGTIRYDEYHPNIVSLINYNKLNNLNDGFLKLKNTDMITIGNELYKSKNPIEIVQKINDICYTK